MVQFVGLATLSDLIHDCSSHCLPGRPYHGTWNRLASWGLLSCGSRRTPNVFYRRLFLLTSSKLAMFGSSFHSRIHTPRFSDAQHPASDVSSGINRELNV